MDRKAQRTAAITLSGTILVGLAFYAARTQDSHSFDQSAPITVLQGVSVAPEAKPDNTALIRPDAAPPEKRPSIVLQHIRVREQQRDERWADDAEVSLRRNLQGAAGGLDVKRIECRTDACEIVGRVAVASADLRDRAVASVMDGTVPSRLIAAGLVPAGDINIDADEDGNLEVTFYASRS